MTFNHTKNHSSSIAYGIWETAEIAPCFYACLPGRNSTPATAGSDAENMRVGLYQSSVEACTVSNIPTLSTYNFCETGRVGGDRNLLEE